MIQDIAPQKLDNQFCRKEVTEDSVIFFFRAREILIRQDVHNNLFLPSFGEWKREVPDKSSHAGLQYYFSIDGTEYFACHGEGEAFGKYVYAPVRSFRQMVSKDVCFAIMTAWHLHQWYLTNQFCGKCGNRTIHDNRERMLVCPSCGNVVYPGIAPAVIVAVTDGDRILMSKYAGRDYKKYALLAGFTEIGETAEETVRREVMEEVGLRVKNIRYYKSQPWGIDGNLLLGFFCELDGSDQIHMDEEELAEAQWFDRADMPAHDDGISLTREMMGVFEKGGVYS